MSLRAKFDVLVAALRGDDAARYLVAERTARRIHPEAILPERGRTWLEDHAFRELHARFADPDNVRSLDRLYMLRELARAVADLPGDTAECGTYRGASSYVICDVLRGTGKRHHVFDSFAGLSDPGSRDGSAWVSGDLSVSETVARSNLAGFDVEFHTGWIPHRFEDVADRTFCLVHIDVDLYEPTRDSIEFFYDRVQAGGLLVLDDYGFRSCPGARAAVDEFLAERPERAVQVPTGQAIIQRSCSGGGPPR